MTPVTFVNQITVEQISEDAFRSKLFPQRLANRAPIAYGGCAAGVAVHAACKTVTKPNLHIFSVLGAFHGPARTDRQINCIVTRTRDTKTFATRRVVASQTQDDGTERACADIFVDFHAEEPAMYSFSAPPSNYLLNSSPHDSKTSALGVDLAKDLVERGVATAEASETYQKNFALISGFVDFRLCRESIAGQNLHGLAKHLSTTQDHLPITEKTSAEWLRSRETMSTEGENAAALAFIMDGALSFLVLNHDKKNLEDAGPCSTLDFALRILKPGFDISQWHLRERRMIAAEAGKTLAESRLWDENGNLVAVESQTCIVRPPPAPMSTPDNESAKMKAKI